MTIDTSRQSEGTPQSNNHIRTGGLVSWAVLLICIHAGLLAWGAYVHSPTLNEPGHLVAGISNWEFGRFDIYKVNTPLARMVAALPVLMAGTNTDWNSFYDGPTARAEFTLGEDFVAANGERSFWLFTRARWACIPFSLLGGYICFRWARELYGTTAGLLTLMLWCFCPNILAHGQVITPDMPTTTLGLTACYAFWHWLRGPTWWQTMIAGLALGLAELTKTTLLIFYPLWLILWLVFRWSDRREQSGLTWLRELGMLAVQMVISVYVINLGYGFEGSGTRLGDFQFVSDALGAEGDAKEVPGKGGNRFADTWLANMPVLLPKNYVLGIDLQKRDFEHYHLLSYLGGEFSEKGWWYYYLYGLAIKVPLGTWILIGLASMLRIWAQVNVRWRDEFVLLYPAASLLAFVSVHTGFSQHIRYVLPVFPFVFIWLGRLAVIFDWRHRIGGGVVSAALTWSIASSLWIYPHSLSYFNELVGGPIGGPAHLLHSNIDWGQDVLILKGWLDEHPEARPLKFAFCGFFDPCHAGVEYTAPDVDASSEDEDNAPVIISPGWYAVSVNFVRGFPFPAYQGDGTKMNYSKNALSQFQQMKPVAMAGYSIYIYHVMEE